MKPVMSDEVSAFLAMTALGAVIVFIFDIFRCFRKVIIRKDILVHISDILFWGISLFITLKTIYIFNDGVLRFCFFVSAFLGGVLYFFTLSRVFCRTFSIILQIFLKIFKIIFKILLTPTHFLYKILLVLFDGILHRMKKLKKCLKRKKGKKRGCRNDKKKQKNSTSNYSGFFSNCLFVNKRSNVATRDKPEQRKDRQLKRTDNQTAAEIG